MKLTTKEIAQRVKKTPTRITQLIYENVIEAEKIGRDWLIDENQICVIANLPDGRGKYTRKIRQSDLQKSLREVTT